MVPESKISESLATLSDADCGDGESLPSWRFRPAVMRYGRIVYRVAHLLLGDRHEAEDVSQEAFLRYWQRGKGVERPKEWLLAVTRNACLDRLRRVRPLVSTDDVLEPSEDRDPLWHVQQLEL